MFLMIFSQNILFMFYDFAEKKLENVKIINSNLKILEIENKCFLVVLAKVLT